MLKFLINLIGFCLIAGVLVEGFDKEAAMSNFMVKVEMCRNQVGAQRADIEDLFTEKPSSSAVGKCLRSCLMKQYQVMDVNGKFVKAAAIKHAEMYTEGAAERMKTAKDIIDACAGLAVSRNHCEAAEQYGKCFKEQTMARLNSNTARQ